jgi:cyclohexa-1,5-dienecarbonyl-CoA hydratase
MIDARTDGRIGWITLNRPPLNVLDIAMMRRLDAALERMLPQCDLLVLEGAGPKGFSAGAEVADHLPERVREMLSAFHAIFRRLARSECITIASVHGHCLGGGMELATFCDFVIAAESSRFGQPEIKLGCFPPVAMIALPQLCGFRAALDLILTGRALLAPEALRLGLVSRVVKDEELESEVGKLLAELGALSANVLRLTRQTLWKLHADDFERRLDEIEHVYFDRLMQTPDAHEGIRAFMEKRMPAWSGRQRPAVR